jgi:hypothetical protein
MTAAGVDSLEWEACYCRGLFETWTNTDVREASEMDATID